MQVENSLERDLPDWSKVLFPDYFELVGRDRNKWSQGLPGPPRGMDPIAFATSVTPVVTPLHKKHGGNRECLKNLQELKKRICVINVQLFKTFQKPVEEESSVPTGDPQEITEEIINTLENIVRELEKSPLTSPACMDLCRMEQKLKSDKLEGKPKREKMIALLMTQRNHAKGEFWKAFQDMEYDSLAKLLKKGWQTFEVNAFLEHVVNNITEEDWPRFLSELGIKDSERECEEETTGSEAKVKILEKWIDKTSIDHVRAKLREAWDKLGYHQEGVMSNAHRHTAFF
ncbi:uncharacterized protein LOC128476939 [Spea bombifrons]|uniref:uncharacterized protein LOC128476939 n=1 Tax=Spea bombifrons TaxID=233779 RepID=UPI002349892F|nr:uncharacterized protein LOC128476939 [Spea bombifrons]